MATKKPLVVFGATGIQGGSVIAHILKTPSLSSEYSIRAITRDPDSPASKTLQDKSSTIQLVQTDTNSSTSLSRAMQGAHTVFAMTTATTLDAEGCQGEFDSAKRIADAAVAAKVQRLIFSTLPAVKKLSGGKYENVTVFDAKAAAQDYIQGLPIQSAFLSLAFFMQNFHTQPWLNPRRREGSDVWAFRRPNSPKARIPFVDAATDTGKFVGAILALSSSSLEEDNGKVYCAAAAFYTGEQMAAIMSRATGKKVVFEQVSSEAFGEMIPYEPARIVLEEAYVFAGEVGYFGPGSEGLVEETDKVIWGRGGESEKSVGFEEYLRAHPLPLE